MPITLVQQGLIAQNDFAKFLMIGGGGRIEIAAPLTDDERRDGEIHERGRYDYSIAAQFKSARRLQLKRGARTRSLSIRVQVRANRVVNHPRYWYFIGQLDLKLMGLADPVFVIPSTVFHKQAAAGRVGEFAWFVFSASVGPNSKDQWQPYRVETHQLGRRVLDIMSDLRKSDSRQRRLTLAPLPSVPDALWLRKAA
jgi:ribosomal protein L21